MSGYLTACSALCILLITLSAQAETLERYSFDKRLMGTNFRIVLFSASAEIANEASLAAFGRIESIDRHLSDYLVSSELNQLTATAGTARDVPASYDLWQVLTAAIWLFEQSDGAFDVTVGPLTRLWRWSSRRGQMPSQEQIAEALGAIGSQHLLLNRTTRSVTLSKPNMRLDLGGIAKGYAVDEALRVLAAYGLTRSLIDGGGDIALGDPPPGKTGWTLELSDVSAAGKLVREHRTLANTAIATSGTRFRYLEVNRSRFYHLVDPRVGLVTSEHLLVTVVAPSAMWADALASALFVMRTKQGLELLNAVPGSASRIINYDNDKYWTIESANFDDEFQSTTR